jgi:hypothetical protein
MIIRGTNLRLIFFVNVLPGSIGSVLTCPGKAAKSVRGGGLVPAAQATR